MNGGYEALAPVYDRLNREVDHGAFADFYETCFRKFGGKPVRSVLDLGCGTGSMTLELARRGYDMTGLDNCADMLSEAAARATAAGQAGILWLEQDMTAFDLYGTVDACVCCLDGINHLWRPGDAARCFSLVHLFLEPEGLFLFDLNTPRKFREVYAGRDYVLEDQGAVCCWRNEWHPAAGTCDFYLTVFEQQPDGSYERTDGLQKERCFTERQIRRLLTGTGFEVLGVYGGAGLTPAAPDCDRWYLVARAKKDAGQAK